MGAVAFTELVGLPVSGRVFSQSFRAGLADCAPSGRVRLDALARWLQDVAYFDVDDAGLADAAVWVVRRSRIRVSRFPRFGERHVLSTFCSGLGRMWAERRTSVVPESGGPSDVEAVSLWVHLDAATKRPAPFTPHEMAAYADASGGRKVTARLRHPLPASLEASTAWRFRATECDVADHVNNAAYWGPIEEELLTRAESDGSPLGGADLDALDVEIEFRSPAQPGDKQIVRDGFRRWIVSEDGEVHASIALGAALTSARS
jgi:acyl-ACP thioesterase